MYINKYFYIHSNMTDTRDNINSSEGKQSENSPLPIHNVVDLVSDGGVHGLFPSDVSSAIPPQCEPSSIQTKDWRKKQRWYLDGKRNECELYQRNKIEEITGLKCAKTSERINIYTYEMRPYTNPMVSNDGFEWSEDFDGKIIRGNSIVFVNLKMVCDSGGAQTRSLREVYHFIYSQIQYIHNNPQATNVYFVNILDGNESHKHQSKYTYLLNKMSEKKNQTHPAFSKFAGEATEGRLVGKCANASNSESPEESHVKRHVFVGDLFRFITWWDTLFSESNNSSNTV